MMTNKPVKTRKENTCELLQSGHIPTLSGCMSALPRLSLSTYAQPQHTGVRTIQRVVRRHRATTDTNVAPFLPRVRMRIRYQHRRRREKGSGECS